MHVAIMTACIMLYIAMHVQTKFISFSLAIYT